MISNISLGIRGHQNLWYLNAPFGKQRFLLLQVLESFWLHEILPTSCDFTFYPPWAKSLRFWGGPDIWAAIFLVTLWSFKSASSLLAFPITKPLTKYCLSTEKIQVLPYCFSWLVSSTIGKTFCYFLTTFWLRGCSSGEFLKMCCPRSRQEFLVLSGSQIFVSTRLEIRFFYM